MPLTHYIIVRRDMPLGVVCAQVTHAAGESFYAFGDHVGFSFDTTGTTAVVLGARDEKQLNYYMRRLMKAWIHAIMITENAGQFANKDTAIGVWPTVERAAVFKVLKKLNPISELSV